MEAEAFVPDDFGVPQELVTSEFRLEPLGPQHNEGDYAAWTSSMEHIAATPGFADWDWPHPMPLEQNLADLRRHAEDFAHRTGFTYTVLASDDGSVVGCVYIYPSDVAGVADVRSWVRADRASLDGSLYEAVAFWLKNAWPFAAVRYAPR
jgi:Acetyltransferase (GNAT) domain